MITIVGRFRVRAEAVAEFERLFGDYAARVKANEPGCLLYQLGRSRADAGAYQVVEIYAGAEALQAHRAAPYFKPAVEALGACMDGAPIVDLFEVVD